MELLFSCLAGLRALLDFATRHAAAAKTRRAPPPPPADALPWPCAAFTRVLRDGGTNTISFEGVETSRLPYQAMAFLAVRRTTAVAHLLRDTAGVPPPPCGRIAAQVAGDSDRPTVAAVRRAYCVRFS